MNPQSPISLGAENLAPKTYIRRGDLLSKCLLISTWSSPASLSSSLLLNNTTYSTTLSTHSDHASRAQHWAWSSAFAQPLHPRPVPADAMLLVIASSEYREYTSLTCPTDASTPIIARPQGAQHRIPARGGLRNTTSSGQDVPHLCVSCAFLRPRSTASSQARPC